MPNAHFSLNRGTCSADIPASVAFWKRVFAASTPQPFHAAPEDGSARGGLDGHWCGMDFASPLAPVPAACVLIASAIMRFSASDSPCACPLMDPMVRAFTISSGGSFLKTDRSGAR
jgi:hypothetical protein